MEEQYIEPTSRGRILALVPTAAYLLGATLMYWLAGNNDQRNEAILAKYSTADYRAIVPVVSQQLLEVAWLRFLVFLAMAGHIFWMTRAIQIAGQFPIPNAPVLTPVLFRTRVRTDPRHIKWSVVFGYVASGLMLLSGLLGFYAWYRYHNIFSDILRSVTN